MCGILGGNKKIWNYENAIKKMSHRGPDGIRIERDYVFNMAFARLAIIDLSENGMQPMFSQDGNVKIVFNGEIYGYKNIKKQLKDKGYVFKSTSDTEVILNAYIEWGEDFIDKIDGMYAIAIWDKKRNKVILYRDRLGIKPLYYYKKGNDFAFSSELKGITTLCSDVNFEMDNTAVYDYLNFRYIPEPKTLYKNVYKLLPGYKLVFDLSSNNIIYNNKYWELVVNPYQGKQKKQEEITYEIRQLIKKSVKEQMVADVSVGTFLSGGVDSSIISYECKKVDPGIQSFSIGFDDMRLDESKYASYFSQKHDIYWNVKKFHRKDIRLLYYRLKEWYDEPFADESAFPTFLVSEFAKEKVTVILTGDGGDEVFGGYHRYGRMWKQETDQLDKYQNIVKEYGGDNIGIDNEWRKLLDIPNDYNRYWTINEYYDEELPPITRCQLFDIKTYLPGDILTKVDRAAMQVSLETRVPFLGKDIVEYAFSLSEEDRCPNGILKGSLKQAYEAEIGKAFLNREKQGFGVPERYFSKEVTKQEELLEKIWHMKVPDHAILYKKDDSTLRIEREHEYAEKHLAIARLYDRWVEVNQQGKSVEEYLVKNNIHTVALYGMSFVGERLYEELKKSKVRVLYGIDRNAKKIIAEIDVYTPDEKLERVDAIIVTSNFYFETIEEELKKKIDIPIINFEDILYEM